MIFDWLLERIEAGVRVVVNHALMIICSTVLGLIFAIWLADIRL